MSPASRSPWKSSTPSSGTDLVSAYTVEARPRVRKTLRQLDPGIRKAVLDAIRALGTDPRPAGVTPLKGHRPWLRVRVGDYRIIYDVDDTSRTVTIAVVGHRREVYRGLDL
jgi:mRNA interferase RelE/StbE